jgi:hypothetical protein
VEIGEPAGPAVTITAGLKNHSFLASAAGLCGAKTTILCGPHTNAAQMVIVGRGNVKKFFAANFAPISAASAGVVRGASQRRNIPMKA